MAAPSTPSNFYCVTGNYTNLAAWDITPTADSYVVQRSLDGVTFTTVATLTGSPLPISYLDSSVTPGVGYYYQVSAGTGVDFSPYTAPFGPIVPSVSGEMSLGAIILASKQRADRVNSNFVTKPEWVSYVNQAMFELYDLLVTTYEDYFIATPAMFQTNGTQYIYNLPDGRSTFTNGISFQSGYIAPPFYKLWGVDLAINTANNAFVTLNKFNPIDRNRYVYPNSSSTIYGVNNMQYRLINTNQIEFIPVPAGTQNIRIWYVPRLTMLVQDADITTQGISGWLEYVIVRAAKYALDKEESDSSKLDVELVALNKRIQETAMNRDVGQPDTIQDTRRATYWGGNDQGGGWGAGGWGM